MATHSDCATIATRSPDAEQTDAALLRIAAAIVWRALLDARSSNGRAAEARRWLRTSPLAREILAAFPGVGVGQRELEAWIEELPPARQPALRL